MPRVETITFRGSLPAQQMEGQPTPNLGRQQPPFYGYSQPPRANYSDSGCCTASAPISNIERVVGLGRSSP